MNIFEVPEQWDEELIYLAMQCKLYTEDNNESKINNLKIKYHVQLF